MYIYTSFIYLYVCISVVVSSVVCIDVWHADV